MCVCVGRGDCVRDVRVGRMWVYVVGAGAGGRRGEW